MITNPVLNKSIIISSHSISMKMCKRAHIERVNKQIMSQKTSSLDSMNLHVMLKKDCPLFYFFLLQVIKIENNSVFNFTWGQSAWH